MLENLKLAPGYDGFIFLAEAMRNPPVLRPHHHVELELNLVAGGAITYVVGGKRHTFHQRELLWIFPSQEHQLVDRTADSAYYVAVFKPDLIQRACRGERYRALRKLKPDSGEVLRTELPPHDFNNLRREMDSILADGLDPDILNREAGFGLSPDFSFHHHDVDWLNASLRHLLLCSWRLQQGHRGTRESIALHPVVCRALRRINSGRQLTESSSDLAAHCGASEAYLSRLFHKQIGVPLSRYRNSVRLEQFWECYRKNGRTNLLEAVFAAGFGSYPQFYRVFKMAYGQGPRAATGRGVRPST